MRAAGGGGGGVGASPKTVDRMLGVLVAACASAMLVALGTRASGSITAFLRLAYDEHVAHGLDNKKNRGGSSGSSTQREGEGDAYHEYAYGSRSAAATSAARARARARAGARDAEGGGEVSGEGEDRLVLHVGSCHCGGLAFEVEAPEHLVAIEGPSKVRYPFITVPAEQFRLTSDDSNGSLYLLKCRPPSGTDDTPRVSAHFFCRMCGVHVVHAPEFPHAAVADVNVHCICPTTIKSLAVAFLRGGGGHLPGTGDPVDVMYEVGKECWSEAVRERVSVALRHQEQSTDGAPGSSGCSNRALSPRRRSSSDATRRGLRSQEGLRWYGAKAEVGVGSDRSEGALFAGEGVGALGGRSGDGTGGVGRGGAPDLSSLRRSAEERERARQNSGGSGRGVSNGRGGRAGGGGESWSDVLMQVASLPSSSSTSSSGAAAGAGTSLLPRTSSSKQQQQGRHPNGGSSSGSSSASGRGWGANASEMLRRTEEGRQQRREQWSRKVVGGGVVNGELSSIAGERHGAGEGGIDLRTDVVANGAHSGNGEAPESAWRRRRSRSVGSTPNTPLPSPTLCSPGAEGVASEYSDNGEEPSGGSRSLGSISGGGGGGGGREISENITHNAAAAAAPVAAAASSLFGMGRSQVGGSPRDGHGYGLVKPPSPVSGGYAAARA